MLMTKSLHLDHVKIDRRLVKTLPVDIAFRYQALPISTDGKKITIAMANPEDPEAILAVTSAIGSPAYLVQVDSNEIEHLLTEIWPQIPPSKLHILHWIPTTEQLETQQYPKQFADHLHADIKTVNIPWHGEKSINDLEEEALQYQPDLIVFQIPEPPTIPRLLLDFTLNKMIERLPASILVFKEPRWPLKKLLLVIRDGNDISETAVDWTILLAKKNRVAVTILPLLPPVPEMYGPFIRHSLPSLLTANDPLGQKMRLIAYRLSSDQVEGNFKLRNDPPLEQLQGEISEGDADLVTIAVEPQNHLWRWLFGEVVNDLFTWFDRPLLITKNITH